MSGAVGSPKVQLCHVQSEGDGVGGYVPVQTEVRVPYGLDALEQQLGPFRQLGARGFGGEGRGFGKYTLVLLPR